MISIPFLSVGLFFLNPILLLVFRLRESNLNKLRFWFMVTSGAAWLLSILFSITNPETRLNFGWNPETLLISEPALIFDGISIPLALSLAGLTLYTTLNQRFSPPQIAWISTLGGICFLAVLSDNIYTFLVFWTLIEIFWITYTVINQAVMEKDIRLILPIIVRLGGPLTLIYAAVIGLEEGINAAFSGFGSSSGPILVLAGVYSLIISFFGRESITLAEERFDLERILRLLPAALSFMLITRGAAIMEPIMVQPGLKIIIAVLTLVYGLLSIISTSRKRSRMIWSYGLIGLTAASALFFSSALSLSWGLIFMLPGILMFQSYPSKTQLNAALIAASIGMLPIPFLPAWNGSGLFTRDLPGILFAISAGILIGGTYSNNISREGEEKFQSDPVPLLPILSPIILLLTQFVVAFESNLLDSSMEFLSIPITVWIPVFLIVLLYVLGERIPGVNTDRVDERIQRARKKISSFASGAAKFINQAIILITRLFEGEGGLIWALLIGFLLLTLITLSGGL
ncbi:MAG: hypothetical protein MUO54_15335 [Anaerolineales bacterium]|nr:hypothetical protein [Anaerolineales bacterium]